MSTVTEIQTAAEMPEADPGTATTRKLTAGELACLDCGAAVVLAEEQRPIVVGSTRWDGKPATASVAWCADCRAIHAIAEVAVARNPGLAATFGKSGALHMTDSALLAIQVLGGKAPDPEHLDRATLRSLQAHLAAPGVAVRWISKLAPMVTDGASGRCAVEPWAHLRDGTYDELLGEARRQYANWLAERAAARRTFGPVEVALPADLLPDRELCGCLMCGVDTLVVAAEEVRALGGEEAAKELAWRPLVVSTPSVLGAPPSAEPLRGFVCITCDEAVRDVGAIGSGAVVVALRRYLRLVGQDVEASRLALAPGERMGGAVGWAGWALRERRMGHQMPAPNVAPWSHIEIG